MISNRLSFPVLLASASAAFACLLAAPLAVSRADGIQLCATTLGFVLLVAFVMRFLYYVTHPDDPNWLALIAAAWFGLWAMNVFWWWFSAVFIVAGSLLWALYYRGTVGKEEVGLGMLHRFIALFLPLLGILVATLPADAIGMLTLGEKLAIIGGTGVVGFAVGLLPFSAAEPKVRGARANRRRNASEPDAKEVFMGH